MRAFEERKITVFVTPSQLRRWARDMEEEMADLAPGKRVWKETIGHADTFTVELLADQEYFHRLSRGLPDWDELAPSPEALAAFEKVKGGYDFPDSYSGAGWRAAWTIWKGVKDSPALLDATDGFHDIPGVDVSGLGLSGFQFGWALNAVRQMLGRTPGSNPAILTIGVSEEPPYPSVGPAESAMRRAIG